jgi:hypothetical protein
MFTADNGSDAGKNTRLTHGGLLELPRWNTPTVYNGWEQVNAHDGFNLEETIDLMPQMANRANPSCATLGSGVSSISFCF